MRIRSAALAAFFAVAFADAQTMSIEDYEPRSTLVVPEHTVTRAKYPFVDVHNHQNIGMSKEEFDRLVNDMDALNITSTSACSRRRTSTSTTTESAPSGRCTASICRTRS